MGDGSVTAPATGSKFAVDTDGSGNNWPYSKTAFGASGTQTEVSASNPLPIRLSNTLPTTIQSSFTPSSSAYYPGDNIGPSGQSAVMTISGAAAESGGNGIVNALTIIDTSGQLSLLDVLLFNADPTGGTYTDGTALVPNLNDFKNLVGIIHVVDWSVYGYGIGQAYPLGLDFVCDGSANLYAVPIVLTNPTLGADQTLVFTWTIDQY